MGLLERGELSMYVALEIMKTGMAAREFEAFKEKLGGRITVRSVRTWRKEVEEQRSLFDHIITS